MSASGKHTRNLLTALAGVVAGGLFLWLYTAVAGGEMPPMARARRQNAEWKTKMEMLNRRLDLSADVLNGLMLREQLTYRHVFGMDDPSQLTPGPLDSLTSSKLEGLDSLSPARTTYLRLDAMLWQARSQTASLHQVDQVAGTAGDMLQCIPAISPLNVAKGTFTITSPFGHRSDPMNGAAKMHEGIDMASKQGTPVYAPGDGVVESCRFQLNGYGNELIINHGFGYKTRYAHLYCINVAEGMKVHRGECVAEVGTTGKSTGPHLHYEVMYRGNKMNPVNFFDLSIDPEQYELMIAKRAEESPEERYRPVTIKNRQP